MPKQPSYYDVLSAAIDDVSTNGFDSAARIEFWAEQIRRAAERDMGSESAQQARLGEAMRAIYARLVERGQINRYHFGMSRFTLDKVRPQLRAELDRRIMAAASLIRLNRSAAIEKTLQRFAGWSTSIPKGGSRAVDKRAEKKDLKKALRDLPFVERRVLIDQGTKLTASIGAVLAKDGNAIAAIWHSHWRQSGYNYRVDHKERDQHVYVLRGNWAISDGLMTKGAGYMDEMTEPAEEPFCRCYYQYIYNLSALPQDMLTKKGADKLREVQKALAA